MKHIRPIGDKVVIRRKEEEKMTVGGLYIPENAQQKSFEGEVLAIGTGKVLDNGEVLPMSVKVGSRVMFPAHSYHEVKIDGENYIIMHETDLLLAFE